MRIKVKDAEYFFDVEGTSLRADGANVRERPTVLMLHGGPGLDQFWLRPHHSPLAEVAQIVYLDQRGHGRSGDAPPQRRTLSQWADDVRDFCDALGIVKPIVLGSSFGGFVAMKYAARYPDQPGKLILVSTMARFRLERALAVFERLGGAAAREIARAFWERPSEETLPAYIERCLPLYTRAVRDPNQLARVMLRPEMIFHFYGGEGRIFDLNPELSRVRCPVLIVAGEDDPITPPAASEDIAASLPKGLARLVRFPNCGHEVVLDDPDGYFRTIKDFISGPASD